MDTGVLIPIHAAESRDCPLLFDAIILRRIQSLFDRQQWPIMSRLVSFSRAPPIQGYIS